MYKFHVKIRLRSPFAGDIWSTSNFQIHRANVNTLTKSSLYTNEVTEAALRCTLDTIDRFQKRLSPRPLDYSNINVKVCQLRTVHMGGGTGRLPGRDVCRDRTIAGAGRLPGQEVCRDGTFVGAGRLPGQDDCRGGTFAGAGRLPGQDVLPV